MLPKLGFATAQIPDVLIWNQDTLGLFANPLELLYPEGQVRPQFYAQETCAPTSCWRGYYAEWKLVNEALYLTGIYSCCYQKDKLKADLQKLFGSKYQNGQVKADWVNGNLLIPKGKLLYYVHMGYESIYEKEKVLSFHNGMLTNVVEHDNSKSKPSIYARNREKLEQFIYSKIQWDKLPKLMGTKRVYVQLIPNESGKIESVILLKGEEKAFNEEALRVVRLIPSWDVYYRQGKLYLTKWALPIIFSQEKKRQYSR